MALILYTILVGVFTLGFYLGTITKKITIMKEKINIAELLKDCPSGMELDCTLYEDVYFDHVDNYDTIHCYIQRDYLRTSITFNHYGTYNSDPKSKCVIFPKGKTTWENFNFFNMVKDGDIIYIRTTSNIDNIIIYKKSAQSHYIERYVNFSNDIYFYIDGGYVTALDRVVKARFATEEEKQKLFKAIKDKGYKWNAEIKTLERLPKFKVGDKIKHEGSGLYCTLGEYSQGISAYRTNIGLSLTKYKVEYNPIDKCLRIYTCWGGTIVPAWFINANFV